MRFFVFIFNLFSFINLISATLNEGKTIQGKINDKKCKEKSIKLLTEKITTYFCRDLEVNLTFSPLNLDSDINSWYLYIYFKLRKPSILDYKFQVRNFYQLNSRINLYFNFRHVIGYDIQSFSNQSIDLPSHNQKTFSFYESTLAFYSKGKLIKTCHNFTSSPKSLFQTFSDSSGLSFTNVLFYRVKFKPICPLAFSASQIFKLSFSQLIDTFYKTNLPRFNRLLPEQDELSDMSKYPYVFSLELILCEKVKINSDIINPFLFRFTQMVDLSGEIESIEIGTFKKLKFLSKISIGIGIWRKLFHKGIDWIKDFNSESKFNLSDSKIKAKLENLFLSFVCVTIENPAKETESIIQNSEIKRIFPNKDFCVYANFPFEQLVFVQIINKIENVTQITCTFAWLIQFYPIYPRNLFDNYFLYDYFNMTESFIPGIKQLMNKCNFPQR